MRAGAQALLAEKARLAAEHAEMQQKNSLLLARLQLAEDGGAGLREGSPCSPLGEPAGAQDLQKNSLLLARLQLAEDSGAALPLREGSPCSPLGEPVGAKDLPAKAQESPGAHCPPAAALGEPAGAHDLPAKLQDSPGARAAALAHELEVMKGMLFECAPT